MEHVVKLCFRSRVMCYILVRHADVTDKKSVKTCFRVVRQLVIEQSALWWRLWLPSELPRVQQVLFAGKPVEGEVLTALEVIPTGAVQEEVWRKYKKELQYQWYGTSVFCFTWLVLQWIAVMAMC